MNSKCHRRASTSTFRPLLIIESAPLGPRISNLVRDHETAGHANNLGRIIVADELRTLTLRTQSSRPRTRRNSRYLFQRLSQVFLDRKSTRLNSSHSQISYAVFCLKT